MASAKGGPGRNLKWGMPTKVVRVPEPMVDDVMEWIDENAWRYRMREDMERWAPGLFELSHVGTEPYPYWGR